MRLVARWQGDGRVESLGGRYGGVRISKGVKEYQQISKSSIFVWWGRWRIRSGIVESLGGRSAVWRVGEGGMGGGYSCEYQKDIIRYYPILADISEY